MTTVLVSGVIANKHRQGGAVWTRLNWALGLQRLGFDVCFVEQIAQESCVDAAGAPADFDACENVRCFDAVVQAFGLGGSAVLVCGPRVRGMSFAELLDRAEAAAFLINISGHLKLEPVLQRVRCKAYVDLDPGFTQIWHASGVSGGRMAPHDLYFTVGENIGRPGCSIPTCGLEWLPVRQPVVLDEWPVSTQGPMDRFTTVASWRGPFGPLQHQGATLGLKVHEFRKFLELPLRVDGSFELALDIHPSDGKDRNELLAHGWRVVDSRTEVPDPWAFRQYVQRSGAEFSVAQGVYVDTRSGWFSDRTVRYLASGKPALVQDTGLSEHYPVGEGLLTFRTIDEAARGAKDILEYYETHSTAARRIAATYFDSDVVLGSVVDRLTSVKPTEILL